MYTTQSLISFKTLDILVILHPKFCYRYVPEPQLCKQSIFFFELPASASRRRWKTPEIEVVTFDYPLPTLSDSVIHSFFLVHSTAKLFDNRNIDTSVSKMHIWKISEICDFWLKTRFFTKKFFFSLKTLLFRLRPWNRKPI